MSSTGTRSRSVTTREAITISTLTAPVVAPIATSPGPLDKVRNLPSLTGLRWATAMLIFGHHLMAVEYFGGTPGVIWGNLFEAGKTGTGNASQQHIGWGWSSGGRRYFSAVIDSSSRYTDARAMMDDVIAAATTPRRRPAVVGLV